MEKALNAELTKKALEKVGNPNVLVNLISRRVRQLNSGAGAMSRPLVEPGNLGAADRIRAGYNEIVGAFKRQDYTAVNVKIQEIVPLVNQFANVPVPDLSSIDPVPKT